MTKNHIEIIDQTEIDLFEKKRKINIKKLFTSEGMDLMIAEIKKEVADFSADITTKEGRAKIVSMAAKVAKCKSPIEKLAREVKEDSRRLIDGVNAQWNRYESAMNELRDKIRKPVDEIEQKEAAELKARQDRLAEIESYKMRASLPARNSKFLELSIRELEELAKFEWNDFAFKAENLIKEVAEILNQELLSIKKQEADAAELAQLKKEKAERDQKDHEEKIAREAAEKAKFEAEEKEKIILEKLEIEWQKSQENLLRIHLEKKAAEERAKEVERLAIEQAEKAELARIEAERKAKEDAEKAAADAALKAKQEKEAREKAEKELAAQKAAEDKRNEARISDLKAQNAALENHVQLLIRGASALECERNEAQAHLRGLLSGDQPSVPPNDDALICLLTDIAQILDVVKTEWAESWTDFDQSAREQITQRLQSHYDKHDATRPPMKLLFTNEQLRERIKSDPDIDTDCGGPSVEPVAARVKEPAPEGFEEWWHLRDHGYAPGNYIIRCLDCKQQCWDCDKRAARCRPCAEKRHAAETGDGQR